MTVLFRLFIKIINKNLLGFIENNYSNITDIVFCRKLGEEVDELIIKLYGE